MANGDGNWRLLFFELWPLRRRFRMQRKASQADADSIDVFRLATFCRMRPPGGSREGAGEGGAVVVLPLHQRVALLRQQDPKLTQQEAMKIVLNPASAEDGFATSVPAIPDGCNDITEDETLDAVPEGGYDDGFAAPSSSVGGPDGAAQAEDAACGGTFTASVLSVTEGSPGSVLTVSAGIGLRSWNFDHTFNAGSQQKDVHNRCGLRLAVSLLNGLNGALITYGQTGSGKTHTMFGPPPPEPGHPSRPETPGGGQAGVVSRIAKEILSGIAMRRAQGFEVSLGASYVEVFGNDITNLLGGEIGPNRGASQRMAHRYVLDGRVEERVADEEAFEELLERGAQNKRQAHTAMNERSTRAHALVILRLRQKPPGATSAVESLLSLVDLGGSERVTKSKANEGLRAPGAVNVGPDGEESRVSWQEYYQSRERIAETNNINTGLLTLKRCIQAINERQECLKKGSALPRIPFHDSKLTMLLQPALGGECNTSVVVCCSPNEWSAEETVQSLRFGEMCGSVEQRRGGAAADTSVAVAQALRKLDAEIADVEAAIREKERWEWRAKMKTDVVDEMDTGVSKVNFEEIMELGLPGAVEIAADDGRSMKKTVEHEVWGQVLVGAEAENLRREELLRQRTRLLRIE